VGNLVFDRAELVNQNFTLNIDKDYVLKDISPNSLMPIISANLPTEADYNRWSSFIPDNPYPIYGYQHIQAMYTDLPNSQMFEVFRGQVVLDQEPIRSFSYVGTSKEPIETGQSHTLAVFEDNNLLGLINVRIKPTTVRTDLCDRSLLMGNQGVSGAMGVENPAVLVHGWNSFDRLGVVDMHLWSNIAEALTSTGAEIFSARVDAWNTSEARGEQLITYIECVLAQESTGGRRVDLIGHSQGAPTARYAAYWLGEENINSVTGVSGINDGGMVNVVNRGHAERAHQKLNRHYQNGKLTQDNSLDSLIFALIDKDDLNSKATTLGQEYQLLRKLLMLAQEILDNIIILMQTDGDSVSESLIVSFNALLDQSVQEINDNSEMKLLLFSRDLCGDPTNIEMNPFEWFQGQFGMLTCKGSVYDHIKHMSDLMKLDSGTVASFLSQNLPYIEIIRDSVVNVTEQLDRLDSGQGSDYYEILSNIKTMQVQVQNIADYDFDGLRDQLSPYDGDVYDQDDDAFYGRTFIDGLSHAAQVVRRFREAYNKDSDDCTGSGFDDLNFPIVDFYPCYFYKDTLQIIEDTLLASVDTLKQLPSVVDAFIDLTQGDMTYSGFIQEVQPLRQFFLDVAGTWDQVEVELEDNENSNMSGSLVKALSDFTSSLQSFQPLIQNINNVKQTMIDVNNESGGTIGDDASWGVLKDWQVSQFTKLRDEIMSDFLDSEAAIANKLFSDDDTKNKINECLLAEDSWLRKYYSDNKDSGAPPLPSFDPENSTIDCVDFVIDIINAVVDTIVPLEEFNPITNKTPQQEVELGLYGISAFGSQLLNLKYPNTGKTPGRYLECIRNIDNIGGPDFSESATFNDHQSNQTKYYSLIAQRQVSVTDVSNYADLSSINMVVTGNNTDPLDTIDTFAEYYSNFTLINRSQDVEGEPRTADLEKMFKNTDFLVNTCSQELGHVVRIDDIPNLNHGQMVDYNGIDGSFGRFILGQDPAGTGSLVSEELSNCNSKSGIVDRKVCLTRLFPRMLIAYMTKKPGGSKSNSYDVDSPFEDLSVSGDYHNSSSHYGVPIARDPSYETDKRVSDRYQDIGTSDNLPLLDRLLGWLGDDVQVGASVPFPNGSCCEIDDSSCVPYVPGLYTQHLKDLQEGRY
jgi:hypothetical protein